MLLLSEHQLDSMSLLRRTEACWTIVCDHWQLDLLREGLEQCLSAGDKRSNNTKVTLVDCIVCLHRSKLSIVEA